MPEALTIDPLADPAWLEFIEQGENAEIFHHPRWLGLLREQYGYEVEARCIANGGGIESGIPIARIESRLTGRRLVSLPFSDVCLPVTARGTGTASATALGVALAEHCKRSGLELTVHGPMPDVQGTAVADGFFRHLLALGPDPEAVARGYAKSHPRGARKARREGLRGELRTDPEAIEAFYGLHLRTRRRLGVPTQPKRFVRRFQGLFDAGLGFIWLILDDGRPVAAAVFLAFRDTLTYKYGAADEAALAKRPNNLLFSEVIEWACQNGFRTLDFGRTDADNQGLRAFKRGWGAEEAELPYTHFTDRGLSSGPGLVDRLATTTIKHTPPVVGRLAGAALYRHYA
jgi:CelD/BcsL family acetyltransferase involved in cellulose biosynthesis